MALFTSVFKGTALVLVLVSEPALARVHSSQQGDLSMKQITAMRKLRMLMFAFGAAAVVTSAYSPAALAGPLDDACSTWNKKVTAPPKASAEFGRWLKQLNTKFVVLSAPRDEKAEAACKRLLEGNLIIRAIEENPFNIPARVSVEFFTEGGKPGYRFHF
jgi:hypothetical protein